MNRKRALLIVLLGLIAGLSAMVGASRSLSGMSDRAAAPPPELAPVVVAKTDVPQGERLRKENLEVVSWPASVALPSAARRIDEVENRVTSTRLIKGEPVLEDKLAPPGSASGLAAFVSSGMRAVTVRVNDVIGVGGFVAPASRVDVLTTIDVKRPKTPSTTVTKVILQDIQVLAVDKRMDSARSGAKAEKARKISVATLLVTPEQAERLTLAAARGQILLALRNTADKTPIQTPGITPRELIFGKAPAAAAPSPPPPKARPKPKVAPAPPRPPKRVARVEVIRGGKRSYETLGPQSKKRRRGK
ncbi:MAG: Flp pilus assembly protein CpaB [Nitrospinota bacterium]